jgi:hypothetical protein
MTIIKTNGPVMPKACPFPPMASIVLDPSSIEMAGGHAWLDAWCDRRNNRKPLGSFETPCVHREGDFLYFRYRWLADELRRHCPLFRSPVGDRALWESNR